VSLVDIRREGQVCVLTLQREEKLNALSGAMERELLDSLSGDDVRGSRCVVLTGAGKAFSAGADINEFADADAASIAAYYADTGDVYRRAASYVDRLLKGAKPADLPIEQPTKFELVANLRTAKALDIMLPRSIILRADRLIE